MLADRAPATASVETRLVSAAALRGQAAAWDRLAAEALEENPFFSRRYVVAGLETIDRPESWQALAILRGGQLIGLLPLRSTFFRYGVPASVDLAHLNEYGTSGTPLLRRDHAEEAADALLGAVAGGTIARNMLLEQVRSDGPVCTLLRARAEEAGVKAAFLPLLRRPLLRPEGPDADAYLRQHLAPKRLRELQRSHRRLGEVGAVSFQRVTDPQGMAEAVEAFARLESAGWKGRAGTAFDSRPASSRFLRRAFPSEPGGPSFVSADLLRLDGRVIAANLNLQTGRTSFALKTAYDEDLRRYSPGLVLELLVIRHLFETRFADEIDSCVTEEGHVIQSLWSASAEVGTLALSAARSWPMALAPLGVDLAALETQRIATRRAGKRLFHAARERWQEMKAGSPSGQPARAA